MARLDAFEEGRTDLVFELLAGGSTKASDLMGTCAYFGDVSAIKFLLTHGAALKDLGEDLGLIGACFHGHWRLVQYLLERGAKVNWATAGTGETALHSALSQTERARHNLVVKVLLAAGADPNKKTKKNIPTEAFMRDCRTKGETPLHRAAAFGDEQVVQMLIDAGAKLDVVDMNGDTPLSWGSWMRVPRPLLRKLLFGKHSIKSDQGMEANLIGGPPE